MKKGLIIIAVIAVIGLLVVLNLRKEGSRVEVRVTEVTKRDIIKYITASGRIQPTRQVDVSASSIGKVTRLAVKEGDYVEKGDFLLQIDPTEYQSMFDRLEASIRSASATVEMEWANLKKSEYDLERVATLREQEVVSEEELRTARLNVDIARAKHKSAQELLSQHEANLRKAAHDLKQVRITADISGVITALNVEEGENAIMGTLNNPGTVLLTVADLSEIETEVEVDETEVVYVKVGQEAIITLDAYPDSSFAGTVTEVGNSAIRTQVGLGQSSVDFKVVVTLTDRIPNVRPGLSASAKIRVAEAPDALSIPIQCLTVRKRSEFEEEDDSVGESGEEDADVEGVFVVESGAAVYRPVIVGIAGSNHFEVTKGLEEGALVVSGPFKAINDLKPGDPVKTETESPSDE
ncbi:MAG: efflux RND transporter periplasmic adaptor subunit [Candidatus Krumholzibacteriia bacterium]